MIVFLFRNVVFDCHLVKDATCVWRARGEHITKLWDNISDSPDFVTPQVSWKLARIHPPCDSCTLPEDFEGATDGSSVFPNGVVGAKRTVKLRVRPFLGECTTLIIIEKCTPSMLQGGWFTF